MALDGEQVRAYMQRPWGLFEQLRDEQWGAEVRKHGPARAIALSWHLSEQLRAQQPDWPTEDDRLRDLANHVRLRELLDRAGPAFGARRAGS